MPYILEHMSVDDISEVARIERLCFSMPWPTSAYRRELKTPDTNRYIVARFVPPADASAIGLPLPSEQNLTNLRHSPSPRNGNGHSENPPPGLGNRSWLVNLLPWRRQTA